MKRSNWLLCVLWLVPMWATAQKPTKLASPDAQLTAVLLPGKTLQQLLAYDLGYAGKTIVKGASFGLSANTLSQNWSLKKVQQNKHNTAWKPLYGERDLIPDRYNELVVTYLSAEKKTTIRLWLRAYNEGFAFRYEVTDAGGAEISISEELSSFPFGAEDLAWTTPASQGVYKQQKISSVKEASERPLTIELQNGLFAALGEAEMTDFARAKFISKNSNTLVVKLESEVKSEGQISSPWRFVMVAKSPGKLLEQNYFIQNLNPPSAISNTSWIKPGKVIRESTLTTEGAISTINFAEKNRLQYILFDAGWYGREDADTSDATRVSVDPARSKGPLDLQKVIAYGLAHNVGVILYVNRRALERQADTLFPLYKKWGVKGVKFGFVHTGAQQWGKWVYDAVEKAAQNELMVDIHDDYRPTGISRTWPNLLTQEGIRGDEETVPSDQTLVTLFTRMLAGAGDQTNCYYGELPDKMGSHATQMAKTICIYSPWQFLFWYDSPLKKPESPRGGLISDIPDLQFFRQLPTVWNETRVLEGKIGKYATVARRNESNWYIGSMNAGEQRTLTIDFSFLKKDAHYKAFIYSDDKPTGSGFVNMQTVDVDFAGKKKFTIGKGKGLAIQILKQ